MFALLQSCSSIASRNFLTRPVPVLASSAGLRCLYSSLPPRIAVETMQKIVQRYDTDLPQQTSMDKRWKEQSQNALLEAERQPPAHAYTGRSVHVSSGKVADAIRTLDNILNRNKVRYYLRQQQRHEKRGEKLRRLRSERWRKQFANEVCHLLPSSPLPIITPGSTQVRKKVQLVTKIRNRGA
ncbi:hypothetical protein NMY22_g4103 [Coprinellus aureogranulatus]|nr:hypothetical protein NMY22_g4103 [Coprinellus aureogranulatus]